jgi:hypothetical protein
MDQLTNHMLIFPEIETNHFHSSQVDFESSSHLLVYIRNIHPYYMLIGQINVAVSSAL